MTSEKIRAKAFDTISNVVFFEKDDKAKSSFVEGVCSFANALIVEASEDETKDLDIFEKMGLDKVSLDFMKF